ncbi:TetR family transcriptional regulator [Nocardioides limicola]|uniref:TetR family transcriptional regulator n=1 Tax=Nocardioides limicola TaxID=2803368 RepID=UPI00193BFFBD|nr:TetR family transcriptional regulator [Nocardioides sp. DJM-14]
MSTRERIVEAAFALCAERGFDATTVDDVARRAGVGRSTFFRSFASKEEVILPELDALLGAVEARLAAARPESDPNAAVLAVTEAARLVLQHYLDEGERARTRYHLVSSVPSLRTREVAGQIAFQRVFRTFLGTWLGPDAENELRAELVANAIVTGHNFVLRRWLRGLTDTPTEDFDAAMAMVRTVMPAPFGRAIAPSPTLADRARRVAADLEALLPALHDLGPPEE